MEAVKVMVVLVPLVMLVLLVAVVVVVVMVTGYFTKTPSSVLSGEPPRRWVPYTPAAPSHPHRALRTRSDPQVLGVGPL